MTPSPHPRPTPIDRLYTAYVYALLWLGVVFYLLVLAPYLFLAAHTFDKTRSHARRAARFIFTTLVGHFCRLRRNRFIVDPAPFDWSTVGPCIVVANHASIMDSVLLMSLPPGVGNGRVWAKSWPFKVPLLGALMRLSGHLFVEDFNILPDAQSCLSDGTSLLVFPESSRTRNGKLGRFRDGAFLLAVRTGFPIVPVAIHGSFQCIPPGQSWVFPPQLRITPLAVLYPNKTDPKPHLALKRQAHALIAAALEQPAIALRGNARLPAA
jgi:1-acyl-sn-glycerol-3-phosphate acyltransferase